MCTVVKVWFAFISVVDESKPPHKSERCSARDVPKGQIPGYLVELFKHQLDTLG